MLRFLNMFLEDLKFVWSNFFDVRKRGYGDYFTVQPVKKTDFYFYSTTKRRYWSIWQLLKRITIIIDRIGDYTGGIWITDFLKNELSCPVFRLWNSSSITEYFVWYFWTMSPMDFRSDAIWTTDKFLWLEYRTIPLFRSCFSILIVI